MDYDTKEIETPSGICRLYFGNGEKASGRLIIHESGEAWASEAPSLSLTSITKAVRDEGMKTIVKGGELTGFIIAIYISYLKRMKLGATDEREREQWEYEIMRQVKGSGCNVTRDEVEDGFFEQLVEKQLVYTYNQAGHVGVLALGRLIEMVEMKSRFTTEEERFFLKCVKEAAEEAEGVPTKKHVEGLWMHPKYRVSHGTHKEIRDRLGFSWLPQDRGGKTAPGREKTCGKGRDFFPG